ncbi:lysosome membrane protein 2c [Pundamilia nyererei]|uniref:Lysosome membrane protein 2c n=1 Tax=Pundamilia nyererei TaxID=303518 RepID=A0A9Y6JB72_9CICH|nr:PREDICTED: lysosome membrane protein 2-like [Pundamilia nyererei]
MVLKSCCVYSVGVVSVLMLILGISLVLTSVFPHLVQSMVKKQVVLKNDTDAFEAWKDPPAHIYMQFYFFNLTNPQEVLDGERPAVVEIGPYTYREYRPMEQIDFQDNGTKVTAVNTKTYIFQRNMSRGPESDLIRTVNIPAMTVMERFKVISLLHLNNASNDGEYVFFTGQQNYRDFSRVDTWKGESSLNWWTSDECNMINGTIGTGFHPVITKNDMLYIFSSDLCRSLYTVYEEDVTVKGITGYRFVPPSSVFANLTVNPDNAGFCVPAGNCLGSGLLNVSVCKEGAPIIMSSPHFYQADEKFAQDVFGMTPNKEEHQTAIDINPLTGVVLQTAKRLQINVYVEQIPTFSQTGNVRTVVFPVAYLNESATIDDTAAKKLKAIGVQQNVVENIPFMLIGLAIIVGGIFMFLVCQQKVPESSAAERQPLLSS